MANPLTGDFEAALQVSGGTINRLLASLHQNGIANRKLPSFPHSVQIRIGESGAIDGVRGLVRAQVGAPRVELIHGATDRFRLEVGVRAWFTPDYDGAPFPAFVHGTVHAEYRLADIDPHCVGWSHNAADYLWVRVVKESVRFEGTADDDVNPLDSMVPVALTDTAAADAANVAKVTRQIAVLLAMRFLATPHPVGKRFRRGAMRSLNVPGGGIAVVTAIGLSGDPVGNIASVNNVLLGDADMALGLNVGFLMSVVSQSLGPISAFHQTVKVHVGTPWPAPDIDTVYRVTVNPPSATWEAHGGYALIKVKVHGAARTDSVLADATFDVAQDIVLGFNAGSFTLTPGGSTITVHAGGLYHGTVRSAVENGIRTNLPVVVQTACEQGQPKLGALTTRTQELTQQMRTLDAVATVALNAATFTADGIVLRGTIGLGHRAAPVVQFEKTADGKAFSALQSWIPGGRIDRFDWSWSWGALSGNQPGSARRDDRFLLRRPLGEAGRWVAGFGTVPLPGLDGWGRVCLTISGVTTDPVTGNLARLQSVQRCSVFGLYFLSPAAVTADNRLFMRDITAGSGSRNISELPLVAARATLAPGRTSSNTLVVRVDRQWDGESAATLERGLTACARYDAGLSLLVLFPEGALDGEGRRAAAEIEALGRRLGIAAHVNEDVRGDWRKALRLDSEPHGTGWAVVGPDGNTAWTHTGPLDGQALGAALDLHLRPSVGASAIPHELSRKVGELVDSHMFQIDWYDQPEPNCPPLPIGARGTGSLVSFVLKESAASLAELHHLAGQQAGDSSPRPLVAVLDGADAREAEALRAQLGRDITVLADKSGAIADRFGVAIWPTTILVESDGTIGAIAPGGAAEAKAEHGPPASAA